MSSTATHAFFAEDLYQKLNYNIKNKINKQRLMMFSQNTDSLMFYNIINLKKVKKLETFSILFIQAKLMNTFII